MELKTISILGCGWLGTPLAKKLLSKGFIVKGSVTSEEKIISLENDGIKPFILKVTENELSCRDSGFFNTEILIISIPPKRISGIENIYPQQIEQIISQILKFKIKKVILFSSTSVYPENNKTVTENDSRVETKTSGEALIYAENRLLAQNNFETTVIRFGGLIGADRNPARFLLRIKDEIANVPVNLIHQDDCISIVESIIQKEIWGEILNACCPEHPDKKDFYGKAAAISGLPVPNISDINGKYKIVDSSKLINLLGFSFKYNSPIEYLNSIEK